MVSMGDALVTLYGRGLGSVQKPMQGTGLERSVRVGEQRQRSPWTSPNPDQKQSRNRDRDQAWGL